MARRDRRAGQDRIYKRYIGDIGPRSSGGCGSKNGRPNPQAPARSYADALSFSMAGQALPPATAYTA
jgi:hypothetical protein